MVLGLVGGGERLKVGIGRVGDGVGGTGKRPKGERHGIGAVEAVAKQKERSTVNR